MNLGYPFFYAVGYNGCNATFVPILSVSFRAVRKQIFVNKSLNVANLFALRNDFNSRNLGAFLYKSFIVAERFFCLHEESFLHRAQVLRQNKFFVEFNFVIHIRTGN